MLKTAGIAAARGKPEKSRPKVVRTDGKGRPALVTANQKRPPADWESLLGVVPGGKRFLEYGANRTIYSQGDDADAVFYLRAGKVKLAVTSSEGKEAIVAILNADAFFGDGCLAGQPLRVETAVAMTDCSLARIEKLQMVRMLHEQHEVSELFVTHLLASSIRYREDLVDQLFNSSEQRLARILLHLAHFGKESRVESILPSISQENLAEMVGTGRSRVNHFMNKFRKLGFVDYTGGALRVNSGLLTVILPTTPIPKSR
jgi:CRP-like cAMP-binding protein